MGTRATPVGHGLKSGRDGADDGRPPSTRTAVTPTTSPPSQTRRSHPLLGGPRIGLVLAVLALVPLSGVVLAGADQLAEAGRLHERAGRVELLGDEVVELVALQGAVTDEMNSRLVVESLGGLGVTVEMVDDALDIDLGDGLRESEGAVDELVADGAAAGVGLDVTALRAAERDPAVLRRRYRDAVDVVRAQRDVALDELVEAATALEGGDDLVRSVRAFEATASARQAVAEQFFGVFDTDFGFVGRDAAEVQALIRQRDVHDAATRAIATIAPGSELVAAARAVQDDPQVARFDRLVDETIAAAVTDGAPTGRSSLGELYERSDALQEIYLTGVASSRAHRELVTVARDEVRDASVALQADSDARRRRVVGFVVALVAASAAVAVLATTLILRPLRRLRDDAEALRDGRPTSGHRPRGPLEVRAAAVALGAAADHLDLVTRQAQALGAGDLDDEVLDEEIEGELGANLRHAVATLRTSIGLQAEFQRLLAHEASHDGLTHLPNRTASMAQLGRALGRVERSDGDLGVLFVDLDGFKAVNDQHGHPAGDAVLVEVARRLVDLVRAGDHVGRLGGDEFLVIAEPVDGTAGVLELAARVVDALSEPIEVGTGTVRIGACAGVALAVDGHLTADELVRDADLAVYKAKERGGGSIELCDEELRRRLIEEADLTTAIRAGIAADEFTLHYQPIVATDGELRGLEALIRWARPGHDRLVMPDGFIPFAERSTLVVELDRWVLRTATRQLAAWRDHPVLAGVPVSVNVSSRHLDHDGLVDHVLDAVAAERVDPALLVLEVTESAIIDDLGGAGAKLAELRLHGIRVAIDDFGTGYTSLAHLRTMPIDILKIDRSFTAAANLNAYEESIVRLIIDTGHLLGASITAEGVETDQEASKLALLGSDNLQGYYFSRPQPPELVAEALVAEREVVPG